MSTVLVVSSNDSLRTEWVGVDEEISVGERLLAIGNHSLAQARFAKALERAPESPRLRFLLVLAQARQAAQAAKTEAAADAYRQLLALDPECQEAKDALAGIESKQPRGKGLLAKLFTRT